MRILNYQPAGSGGSEIARVSIEVAHGIRLHDVKVMQSGCVFSRNATFDRTIVEEIFNLVKGAGHNDRIAN
jgi:hypothetical protein